MAAKQSKLSLAFENHFIEHLPGDPVTTNTIRDVTGACYSLVSPLVPKAPKLLSYSPAMLETLGLPVSEARSEAFLDLVSGRMLPEQVRSYAQCYGGHQFGHWAGQLGDGRAINIAEVRDPEDQLWTLQLKGAGPTPYSRHADGLAVLRSSLREYICSEAMFHLGVPTTRALSLVTSGESVVRDMFYDGNPKPEPGAIVCRVAPSFLRFGNFQLFAARGDLKNLKTLADYAINEHFKHLDQEGSAKYVQWFAAVSELTLTMIIHWARVGFVHGVMNTDNMSILGLTIDYGPYGWLDNYDINWTPNTTDAEGKRYRFAYQGRIAAWNLLQLANAIAPLVDDTKPLEQVLEDYINRFDDEWSAMMAQKIGLDKLLEGDAELLRDLDQVLQASDMDMTIFYRELAGFSLADGDRELADDELSARVLPVSYQTKMAAQTRRDLLLWLRRYLQRLEINETSDAERCAAMNRYNPKYVFRNYLAQQVIDQLEQGDSALMTELMSTLTSPYAEQMDREHFYQKRPDWAKTRAGCSMLSCSS